MHRMSTAPRVFVLTQSPELMRWLLDQEARVFRPEHYDGPLGSYRRLPGGEPEWDIWLHSIPVRGEETVWEAAG